MEIDAAIFHRSLHLDEKKLEPPDSECPFCCLRDRQPVSVLQENPRVSLLKCTNCNAVSASRMPTDEALKEYYGSYYKSPMHSDSDENVTFDEPDRFARHLVNTIRQYQTDAKISILDYGGGDGSISYAVAMQLLKNGVDDIKITIIDYDDKTVLSQDARISINRLSSLEDIQSQYSIVIASAIIEHLPRPKEPLAVLLSHLNNGGVFYARTPYVVPLMKISGLIGVKWDFTYPAHIHDLGQDFWEAYFEKEISAGDFQVLESQPSIVETTLNKHFPRTIAAYLFKAPWYLLGRRYKWVGGWEVFVRKNSAIDV